MVDKIGEAASYEGNEPSLASEAYYREGREVQVRADRHYITISEGWGHREQEERRQQQREGEGNGHMKKSLGDLTNLTGPSSATSDSKREGLRDETGKLKIPRARGSLTCIHSTT